MKTLLCRAWLTAALLATALSSLHAALPGLTISGETFTYNAPSGLVTGRLKLPTGTGPFPAVLLSHGKGGTAASMMMNYGNLLVADGLACISPDYTHAGPAVNPPDREGYCAENSRRARACLEILQSLGSIDMTSVGAFGHSMGAYVTAGLCGESASGIRAAALSAGGTSGTTDTANAAPATTEVQGITAPLLMFHGTADTTVPPAQSASLDAILTTQAVAHRRILYTGVGHDISNTRKADIHALLLAWFTQYGVLRPAANAAPSLTAPTSIAVSAGTTSAPSSITVTDALTPATALTLSVFSTNDARLPATSLVLGGTGTTRTLTLTPTAGLAENVEVALVVSDGQLRTAAFVTVAIAATPPSGNVNHRPTLSRIADQRTLPGTATTALAFKVSDAETAAAALTVTASSSNPTLLPATAITLGGSGTDRTLTLTPLPGQTGVAAITLTVSDGEKTTANAFALTVAPVITGNTPPVIQAAVSEVLPAGTPYGSRQLVIKDDDSDEAALTLTATSTNTALVPTSAIALGGQNWGRSITVTPATGQTGRATLTFTVSDGANTASTACVLEVVSGNAPPTFATLPTEVMQPITAESSAVPFSISDAETAAENLRVTATSSNTALLPDSGISLSGTGSSRTLTLLPVPAATGAATVTLLVSDGTFTRQSTLLFIARDPQSAAAQFTRPLGLYALDSANGTPYTTTFGKSLTLRDANIRDLPFVNGYALRLAWNDLESGATPGAYDFRIVANALGKLPPGQRLTITVFSNEPAYIALTPGVQTWNDAGTIRPCPWDNYVRLRRRALLTALAAFVADGAPLSSEPRLDQIDPCLAGGFSGIRDPNGSTLRSMPGYTRAKLLAAVQEEIRAWQDVFPGKFIRLGFWPVLDGENAAYAGVTAWEWLRQQLLAEFDGTTRQHIGFFMENLAAKRAGSHEAPFTATPTTTFGAPIALSRNGAWSTFQMLGCWARPFSDSHVTNTLNGTPNDAMEYAFNAYGTEFPPPPTATTPPATPPPTQPTAPTTPTTSNSTAAGASGGGAQSPAFLIAFALLASLRCFAANFFRKVSRIT